MRAFESIFTLVLFTALAPVVIKTGSESVSARSSVRIEQQTSNLRVVGSNPTGRAELNKGSKMNDSMVEDDDALFGALVVFPALILLSYGIGWVLAWIFQALFLGDPYITPIGWDMKTLVGSIFAGWYVFKVGLSFFLKWLASL